MGTCQSRGPHTWSSSEPTPAGVEGQAALWEVGTSPAGGGDEKRQEVESRSQSNDQTQPAGETREEYLSVC